MGKPTKQSKLQHFEEGHSLGNLQGMPHRALDQLHNEAHPENANLSHTHRGGTGWGQPTASMPQMAGSPIGVDRRQQDNTERQKEQARRERDAYTMPYKGNPRVRMANFD